MKKALIFILIILLLSAAGCTESGNLSAKDPVVLTMWHVYGEQADSPMNKLINEFNETVGKEKGIIINVTALSNSSDIGPMLEASWAGKPGSEEMPDLFFCHNNNAAALGAENLVDWTELFTQEELSAYVDAFLEDGMVEDRLAVFPVSKSTHMLFINGTQFEKFSADTGMTYDDLSTWDGFFQAAEAFYEWSGGKTFCAFDYLLRSVELNAMSQGERDFMDGNGWYDFTNEGFRTSFDRFAQSIAQGHIMISDMYSNTQVMTGDVIAGMGSSAAILYYNDTVTYPDNTSEPLALTVLPMPKAEGGNALSTQAGVGLCALKTTEAKAEAAAVFAKWLTEAERNLDFVTETGYMPVTKSAFEAIPEHEFVNDAYKSLYSALQTVLNEHQLEKEPNYVGYYGRVYRFYGALREEQGAYAPRVLEGASAQDVAQEIWQLFCSIE